MCENVKNYVSVSLQEDVQVRKEVDKQVRYFHTYNRYLLVASEKQLIRTIVDEPIMDSKSTRQCVFDEHGQRVEATTGADSSAAYSTC